MFLIGLVPHMQRSNWPSIHQTISWQVVLLQHIVIIHLQHPPFLVPLMPRPEKKIDEAGVSDFGFHNFQLLRRLRWLTWTGCSRIEDTWRVDKHRSKVGVKEQKHMFTNRTWITSWMFFTPSLNNKSYQGGSAPVQTTYQISDTRQ